MGREFNCVDNIQMLAASRQLDLVRITKSTASMLFMVFIIFEFSNKENEIESNLSHSNIFNLMIEQGKKALWYL